MPIVRKRSQRTAAAFGLLLLVALPGISHADASATLSMSPDQCIALNQGQTCYQTIVAKWQVADHGDYCLFEQQQSEPLACWHDTNRGQAKILFESVETIQFDLRRKAPADNRRSLAQAEITVTWVYRKSKQKRSTWRLF